MDWLIYDKVKHKDKCIELNDQTCSDSWLM